MSILSNYKIKYPVGHRRYLYDDSDTLSGYIKLDGSVLSQTAYPELFNAIGLLKNDFTGTPVTSGTTTTIRSITYNNGLYVYGGFGGVLATSTDAITWTVGTSGTTSTIYSIIYGNGLYVYGGQGGV
jgi:hypothetical protein